ncbi:hypothetical protein EVAR_57505_1 [Eumeta japonica]|uniref:Uncharacterized protein n=1 Tax=Eumeta variegata TaxID=151549 RepID=A0A4C1ZGH4_EUMVA|nr:hypothetical protein EVAR_57505_1 [Eumeta japonica]
MGLRRLIRSSYGHLPAPSSDWLPYSIKVLVKTNEPKLDGVASFNYKFYGLLAPSSDADYHIVSKYSSRDESNDPKLDGVASFNYGVPMAIFRSIQTLVTI